MIKRVVVLTLLLVSAVSSRLSAQPKADIRDNFYDAESWILFEDYKEALPLYLQLLKEDPGNANYKYRIGQCYLNIPGQKEKSIPYLEDAAKKINPNYHEGKFREKGAPYDALYYLANAYRITNQLDKAIDTYNQFRKNLDPDIYDSTVVDMQIRSCINAKELMKVPLYVKKTDLGDIINASGSEFDPVVSDKEDLIVFARSEAFYDAILYSTKVNGKWTGPINLNEILKFDRDLFPSSLSKDGHTLFLYSSADYDGTIYTSEFRDGSWQPMIKLNDNINTKYWESHATISHDNKLLYFTSNRKGTLGGLDIWVSKKDSTGDWGPASNLGPVINTQYNEESPFLTKDDKTLFFSSRGHYNMGGYDIFYSTRLENGEWSKPLNVGYPLNTTDDDVFFKPQNMGYEGYFAMQGDRGPGQDDIYRVDIYSDAHPRKFRIRGVTTVADLMKNFRDSVRISAMNISNKKQVVVVYSDPATGEYEFELPQGKYEITYAGDGGKKVVRTLDLPLLNPEDSLALPLTVLPKDDNVAVLVVISKKNIKVTRGDTVVIPVKTEPESVLTVERRMGDSLISTEQYVMKDSLYTYRFVPQRGDNTITFRLTDKFNNTTETDVTVSRERAVPRQRVIRPEYSSVIVKKQVETLDNMMAERSNSDLQAVIKDAVQGDKHFDKVDDLISYIKEESATKNISGDEVDKIALQVARKDNVLTQAAVDLMAANAYGELKTVLSGLDIYSEELKTWNDLQAYIETKTGGKYTADNINTFSDDILLGRDHAVSVTREKILAVSKNLSQRDIIRQTIEELDSKDIKTREEWISAFTATALSKGLSQGEISGILAAVSTEPGTGAGQFLTDLINTADGQLASVLKSIDLKKEDIETPGELILYLLKNKNKLNLPEDELFKALGELTASEDIPYSVLETSTIAVRERSGWIKTVGIVLAGLVVLIIIFIIAGKKRKNSKQDITKQ
ncbi:MAG TPA: tetratricopeptide repeat protein [Bacteroidales bacterium]|nr:tetratricopeptide repeat protein [Bacteroidales bacterium]